MLKLFPFAKKRIKLTIRSSESNKKIDTIKFSKEESDRIRKMADILQVSEQELFNLAFKNLINDLRKQVAANR